MKVKELIKDLKQFDPEQEVIVSGYEGGYSYAGGLVEKEIILEYHDKEDWWYGLHEELEWHDPGNKTVIKAVLIG